MKPRRCVECAHVALSPIAPPRCFHDGNSSVVGYATLCSLERDAGNCGMEGVLFEPAPPPKPKVGMFKKIMRWVNADKS
jgi:hypothetical protein